MMGGGIQGWPVIVAVILFLTLRGDGLRLGMDN